MDKIFIVQEENRLDKFLASNIDASRNQLENLIKMDYVRVDGKIINKTGYKLKVNQKIEISFLKEDLENKKSEDFIKNSLKEKDIKIIYEDKYLLVINKPSDLTVHNAPSVKDVTLVDWLKLKKIPLSSIAQKERAGIVHRLDKGTSGVMVVAKTNEAHINLSKQLQDKSMGRYYLAIIDLPLKDNIIIEKPISRNPNNRLKMSIQNDGKSAKSAFLKIAMSKDEKYELISAKLFTGRTHQIRVHLSSINRHILGDVLYGFKGNLNRINRFYLHAYNLYLTHPINKKSMSFQADLPDDMSRFLKNNFQMENINEYFKKDYLVSCFNDFI